MKYGVAIDVSKGKSTVVILNVVCEVIEEPIEITHDIEGLKLLEEKINFSNLCDLLFPGYYQLLNENTFILGLEIFKKYYHPEIVINKKTISICK